MKEIDFSNVLQRTKVDYKEIIVSVQTIQLLRFLKNDSYSADFKLRVLYSLSVQGYDFVEILQDLQYFFKERLEDQLTFKIIKATKLDLNFDYKSLLITSSNDVQLVICSIIANRDTIYDLLNEFTHRVDITICLLFHSVELLGDVIYDFLLPLLQAKLNEKLTNVLMNTFHNASKFNNVATTVKVIRSIDLNAVDFKFVKTIETALQKSTDDELIDHLLCYQFLNLKMRLSVYASLLDVLSVSKTVAHFQFFFVDVSSISEAEFAKKAFVVLKLFVKKTKGKIDAEEFRKPLLKLSGKNISHFREIQMLVGMEVTPESRMRQHYFYLYPSTNHRNLLEMLDSLDSFDEDSLRLVMHLCTFTTYEEVHLKCLQIMQQHCQFFSEIPPKDIEKLFKLSSSFKTYEFAAMLLVVGIQSFDWKFECDTIEKLLVYFSERLCLSLNEIIETDHLCGKLIILEDLLNAEQTEHQKALIVKIMTLLVSLVCPIVCDEAPEAHSTAISSHHLILSFSWKILRHAVAAYMKLTLLSEELLPGFYDLIVELFMTLKHKAAFSSVQKTLCESLTAYPQQCQPFLNRIMELMRKPLPYSNTRRSGGLPLLFVTLLERMSEDILNSTILDLCDIAIWPVTDEFQQMDLPQVHALNILRSIVLNTHLSEIALSHSIGLLVLALDLLKSSCWPIRNGALMLYSSIVVKFKSYQLSSELYEYFYDSENIFPLLLLLRKCKRVSDKERRIAFENLGSEKWAVRQAAAKACKWDSDDLKNDLKQGCNENRIHGVLLALMECDGVDGMVEFWEICMRRSFVVRTAYLNLLLKDVHNVENRHWKGLLDELMVESKSPGAVTYRRTLLDVCKDIGIKVDWHLLIDSCDAFVKSLANMNTLSFVELLASEDIECVYFALQNGDFSNSQMVSFLDHPNSRIVTTALKSMTKRLDNILISAIDRFSRYEVELIFREICAEVLDQLVTNAQVNDARNHLTLFLLRMVQDDDVDIREKICAATSKFLNCPSISDPIDAVQRLANSLDVTNPLVEEELIAILFPVTLDILEEETHVLFDKESPNMWKDNVIEAQLIFKKISISISSSGRSEIAKRICNWNIKNFDFKDSKCFIWVLRVAFGSILTENHQLLFEKFGNSRLPTTLSCILEGKDLLQIEQVSLSSYTLNQ